MSPRDALAALRRMAQSKQMMISRDVLEILDAVEDVPDGLPEGFELRVREELARIAPPGASPDVDDVRRHMSRFITDELGKLGFPPFVAALVGAGIKLKLKETP